MDYKEGNSELRDIDYQLHRNLKKLKIQLKTTRKSQYERRLISDLLEITEDIDECDKTNADISNCMDHGDFKHFDEKMSDNNDLDMLDNNLERTPAFNKETADELENKLLKKIKVQDQDKYRSQELPTRLEQKKSRLELIGSGSKKLYSKDKIYKILKMIKYGHQIVVDKERYKARLRLKKSKRHFSERKLGSVKVPGKQSVDSDVYSHHQYQPISLEYFDRSLSSPNSGDNIICEYKSDDAIL